MPIWLTIFIAIPCFALVIYALFWVEGQNWISYLSYGLSAYALVISITAVYRIVIRVKKWLYSISLVKRYRSDLIWRTKLSLHISIAVQLLYVGLNGYYGYVSQSYWFLALAIYYFLLMGMRVSLLKYIRKNKTGEDQKSELKRVAFCAKMLLAMEAVLLFMVYDMVFEHQGKEYPGFMIYAMAAYTFYTLIMAMISLIRYRKMDSPVFICTKIVSFIMALVSMLSLESAMLTEFGSQNGEGFRRLMLGVTGIGVCSGIFVLILYMFQYVKKKNNLK